MCVPDKLNGNNPFYLNHKKIHYFCLEGENLIFYPMRKILFILVSMTCTTVHSQNSENVNWNTINIYELGIPITSCDCNFENLLYNWNKWITNHEETKLLSYEYVEQLLDTTRITYYAKMKCNWNSTGFNKSSKSGFTKEVHYRELNIIPTTFMEIIKKIPEEIVKDSVKMALGKQEIENELEMMRQIFMQNVKLGDRVYLLKFKTKTRIYDYYTVCRSSDNKVIQSDFFSNINERWENLKQLK